MDKWDKAVTAARDVITDNLVHVKEIELWLTGGAVLGGKSICVNSMFLYANIRFDDDGLEKLSYRIPPEIHNELDTEKATMGYVVEYLINHLILPQYFAKFN